MIKFDGTIVQFGFGAVGKSFYEKLSKEIKFDENKYIVITMNKNEFDAFVNLGGLVSNFHHHEITRDNFKEIFSSYLTEGDLLIDFADSVGTADICDWCAENNIMYLNTGETDWPDHWYSIFEENLKKHSIMEKHSNHAISNKYPIVLQHGNNPGLVSHFVKAGIEYIAEKQFKKDKYLRRLINENKFNEAAKMLGIKMIHVNDIDLQTIDKNIENTLYSTWCIDSFFFEMLSESTINLGTHENIDFQNKCNYLNLEKGFAEFKNLALENTCHTYYPNGNFDGFLVPHEETITIANSLEVKENGKTIYRPTVMFLYSPCEFTKKYFKKYKIDDFIKPDFTKASNYETINGKTIVRGYKYPENAEIIYKENITSGTEYVGILLIGDNFDPVWVGNRIESSFLYKNMRDSYWQTPTITPVAMSALAVTCWMIKNRNKGGIYFPDDIPDYKYIIKKAEKYISKTIYKTFDKNTISQNLNINFSNIQVKDIFSKTKKE